jgi:CheY-like chemotaxis protein
MKRIAMGVPVLVVEDDPDIRSTLQMALTDEGYEVNEARNGQEALQLLRASWRPRVVLLDYVLPLLNGIEVLREVAKDAFLQRNIYLCVTARSRFPDAEDRELLETLQVSILFKPFELDELLKVVANAAARLPPPGDSVC